MSAARVAPLGAAATLLVWALFFGGATDDDRLFWIAAAAVLSAGALAAAALLGSIPMPRPGRAGLAFLASLLGLVLWTGASLGWSIVPDHSWGYLNRGLAYFAFAVVGVFVGPLVPRAPRVVASGFLVLLALVVLWALATKAIPSLAPHGKVERLQSPIGFWNALALLAAGGLPLALWLAGLRRRIEAALLAYATSVALLLTLSRAGTAIAVVVVLVWLALVRPRLEALLTVVVAAPPAIVVAALGAAGPRLDGGWFALVFLAGAAVVAVAARRLVGDPRWERRLVLALAVALAGAAIGLGLSAGGPSGWWREFTSPEQLGQSSGRFRSTSSSNRWTWWNEAWDIFEKHPALGTGADSFEVARRPIRQNPINVTEPHSTPLQFLSELGLVGFLLFGATAIAGVLAVRAALRRVGPEDRGPALALALLPLAYLLHALVDFDWDFVAVTGPALFVVGVLAGVSGTARATRRRRFPLAAATVAVASLAALYSLAAPWLAARRVYDSGIVLENDPVAAAREARSAHRLNPLSPEPLWAWGLAEYLGGDNASAVRRFEDAAELQPENWETWYRLGTFEFRLGRYADACYALDLAYRHDPRGPAGEPGAELDQVKKRLPGCPATTSGR